MSSGKQAMSDGLHYRIWQEGLGENTHPTPKSSSSPVVVPSETDWQVVNTKRFAFLSFGSSSSTES